MDNLHDVTSSSSSDSLEDDGILDSSNYFVVGADTDSNHDDFSDDSFPDLWCLESSTIFQFVKPEEKKYTKFRRTVADPQIKSLIKVGSSVFDLSNPSLSILEEAQLFELQVILCQDINMKKPTIKSIEFLEAPSKSVPKPKNNHLASFYLMDLLLDIKSCLKMQNQPVKNIRMFGMAASRVVTTIDYSFSDIDIKFEIQPESTTYTFKIIRDIVFETIKSYFLNEPMEDFDIRNYVKVVQVFNEVDRWILFTILNDFGRDIQLKFVAKIHREYEFTVDSFQIIIDEYLDYLGVQVKYNSNALQEPKVIVQEPKVVVETCFGDFSKAKYDAQYKLIYVKSPREIYGGGILKCCLLLIRNFHPQGLGFYKMFLPRMSERFFQNIIQIDFNPIDDENNYIRSKIFSYMNSHLYDNNLMKYCFMLLLMSLLKRTDKSDHYLYVMHDFLLLTLDFYKDFLQEFYQFTFDESDDGKYVSTIIKQCRSIDYIKCPMTSTSENNKTVVCLDHFDLKKLNKFTDVLSVTYIDDQFNTDIDTDDENQQKISQENFKLFLKDHKICDYTNGFMFALIPYPFLVGLDDFSVAPGHFFITKSSIMKSLLNISEDVAEKFPELFYYHKLMKKYNEDYLINNGLVNSDIYHDLFYAIHVDNSKTTVNQLKSLFMVPFRPPWLYRLCLLNRVPVPANVTLPSANVPTAHQVQTDKLEEKIIFAQNNIQPPFLKKFALVPSGEQTNFKDSYLKIRSQYRRRIQIHPFEKRSLKNFYPSSSALSSYPLASAYWPYLPNFFNQRLQRSFSLNIPTEAMHEPQTELAKDENDVSEVD